MNETLSVLGRLNGHVFTGLVLVALVLVAWVAIRPTIFDSPGGRLSAFTALFMLPALISFGAVSGHLERAKKTDFCLSCHEMEPYGRSLWIDGDGHLPAIHFQNSRVPRELACYTCHTSYTLYGDLGSKLRGVAHVWTHYTAPEPSPGEISLYEPFLNRECLHCHEPARSFRESAIHEGLLADLSAESLSCLDCHSEVHDAARVMEKPLWEPSGGNVGGE